MNGTNLTNLVGIIPARVMSWVSIFVLLAFGLLLAVTLSSWAFGLRPLQLGTFGHYGGAPDSVTKLSKEQIRELGQYLAKTHATALSPKGSEINLVALATELADNHATALTPQLSDYTNAITAVQTAGEQMTQDWIAARAELERRHAASRPNPAPTFAVPIRWTPPAPLTPGQVRLMAWQVIADYMVILAALNAGKSIDTVKESTGNLMYLVEKAASVPGSALPGANAIVPLFKELAGQLVQARLTGEFKKAINKGTPILRKILTVFREDAANHYQLRAALANEDYARIAHEAEKTDVGKSKAGQKKVRLQQLRVTAEIGEFRNSLNEYVRLLKQIGQNIDALVEATTKPIDFTSWANRILYTTNTQKTHWAAYQNVRNE